MLFEINQLSIEKNGNGNLDEFPADPAEALTPFKSVKTIEENQLLNSSPNDVRKALIR